MPDPLVSRQRAKCNIAEAAALSGVSRQVLRSLMKRYGIDRRDFGFEWQMELPNGGEALGWDVTLEVTLGLFRPEA